MFCRMIFILISCCCTLSVTHADTVPKVVKVGIMLEQPPFSYETSDKEYEGLSIKLWELVADELNLKYKYVVLDTTYNGLVQAVYDKQVDVVVAPLSVTYKRLQFIDYARPYFMNNIGLAISSKQQSDVKQYVNTVIKFIQIVSFGVCLFALLLGPCLWFIEKSHITKDEFNSKKNGLACCVWGAAAIFLGHSFYQPKSTRGRLLMNGSFCVSLIFMIGMIAFEISTGVQMASKDASSLGSLKELKGKEIAIEKGSFVIDVAKGLGAKPVVVGNSLEGLQLISKGEAFGFMGDFFLMQYVYEKHGIQNVEMSPFNIANDEYAFALSKGDPLKKRINKALIKIQGNKLAADVCAIFLGKMYKSNCSF